MVGKAHPITRNYDQRAKEETESFLDELAEGCIRIWKRIASMERVLRNDRPRGVMPEVLTARPRSRGISTYWND